MDMVMGVTKRAERRSRLCDLTKRRLGLPQLTKHDRQTSPVTASTMG